jgi:O-methyltransferase domain/Dimerisation domain
MSIPRQKIDMATVLTTALADNKALGILKGIDMRLAALAAQEQHDEVYRLIMAGWGSQVVGALARLSVAEHLDRGPHTAEQIAECASSDPDMTYRLLRAGVTLGLLEYDSASNAFTGTTRLEILHESSPFTLKHYAQAATGPAFWLPALRLSDTVRRGRNYVEEALGGNVWEYFASHDDEARTFRTAMTDISVPVIREAVSAIHVVGGGHVIDIGGAHGAFLGELLQANPRLTGAVLDLPEAMPGVAQEASRRGLADRMSGIAGDFFDSVPVADFYLLKFVLHDWSDRSCVEILSSVRAAMNQGARLFIVEMMFTDQAASMSAALMDMAMLFGFSGRERDIKEYEKLLRTAGLAIVKTSRLHHPYHLIEARPD